MKISNSKKQLAKITHENGGWRDGAKFAAQDKAYCGRKNNVALYDSKPPRPEKGGECWGGLAGAMMHEFEAAELLPNWHQTILSRDEYFHLYPVTEAAPEPVVEAKQTIEQLAADYRNRKDYADRKQQEADAAKADADAKLAELVAAGKALGLVLSVAPSAKTFHNRKVGHPETYTSGIAREVCDGCGAKAGDHFGRAMFCERKDSENA